MRRAAQFTGAALVAAVLMTGCGSGGDKDGGKKEAGAPSAAPSPPAGDGASGGKGGSALDGVYAARSGDGPVGLSVYQGKAALYADSGKRACTGTVGVDKKPVTFTLTCADGNTDRASGKVDQADGKTLVVSWADGRKDTFSRTGDAAQLPDPAKLGGGGLPAPTKLGG
ncbi:hypothetical protein [Streptomyces albireticuli]|uniref:Lipoprotein n=1 Tax=Streptomyces albireticuli TaxID=1940 RepID=A0A2A2DD14_9ACTN|nr:hypothetical protein [Streptomyces albireticuli]MCD9144966.1 hypothetical protein [Streptomyces albireticuli]MCD9164392.1 hypothetical protein [Streptomyces albireticuli]MCD9194103.1 hypothetical protein [Streptomyces albireticuli]PAU49395.1 hypothetical protein CK936_08045 [Streptomyces albireticuli]